MGGLGDWKRSLMMGAAFGAVAVVASPAWAQTRSFELPAQDAVTGIPAFARQAGIQILVPEAVARGKRTAPVHGSLPVRTALGQLLAGSGLDVATDNGSVITLRSAVPGPPAPAPQAGASTEPAELSELVVTAQKREERLQDVPVPVSALNTQSLSEKNQLRLQDYYTLIPGLVFTPVVNGNTSLTIRGVTSGGLTNPTVGVTVDDVPFGAASVLVGGLLVPDFDPGELQRIEVLRGPQGTLYGASSLGGLLKFVTLDPSPDRLTGKLQAGLDTVHGGDEAGFNVRGSVNVPIGDRAAILVSGFDRRDPGYIDDVRTGERDVNRIDVQGGRLSFLVRPADGWSVKLGTLLQKVDAKGAGAVDVPTAGFPQTNGLGDLQQTRIPGTGGEKDTAQSYSAVIRGKLGRVDLTSVTGYSVYDEHNSLDYTYLVGAVMQRLFGVGGANFLNHYDTKKFSQELRANIPIGDRVDWLIGGFYTSERSLLTQNITAADPNTGAIVGSWSFGRGTFHYKEYAVLTDVTVRFTDRFDVQFGGRESHIEVPYDPFFELGPRFGGTVSAPATVIVPANKSSADAFTYLVTPRYRFSPDLMVYARLASGYRPGAPNTGVGVVQGVVPASYAPDKTLNYEVGLKGAFFDRRLTVDASIYHIDWKDLQLAFFSAASGQSYTSNAARAKSEGVELSGEFRPDPSLTVSAWVAYNKAELTEAFPAGSTISAAPGSVLPTVPRRSGNLSAEKRFTVADRFEAFVGGSVSYVGDRRGAFLAAGQTRAVFPSFTQLNLDAGVRSGPWSATLYANNLSDERGVLNGGAGDFPPFHFTYIQPRTVGVNLARTF